MDVIIEINSRSGSSTTNRKKPESKQHKLQHLEQLQSHCLSNWKMKTFKLKSIERTSDSKTKGKTKSQHNNNNNNNTKLSELVTTNKSQINYFSEGEKQIENQPLSRLEMNYIDSVNRELIESSPKMFTANPKRVMSAHKCSDIYKDVINSLINENLLSYSKYYEDYIDTSNLLFKIKQKLGPIRTLLFLPLFSKDNDTFHLKLVTRRIELDYYFFLF